MPSIRTQTIKPETDTQVQTRNQCVQSDVLGDSSANPASPFLRVRDEGCSFPDGIEQFATSSGNPATFGATANQGVEDKQLVRASINASDELFSVRFYGRFEVGLSKRALRIHFIFLISHDRT